MRKIEMMMNSAIRHRKNFSSGNTTVRSFRESVDVFLHGNHIASLDTATHALTLKDGGWQSVTTKSRLNALLEEFVPSMRICLLYTSPSPRDRYGSRMPSSA